MVTMGMESAVPKLSKNGETFTVPLCEDNTVEFLQAPSMAHRWNCHFARFPALLAGSVTTRIRNAEGQVAQSD